MLRLDEARDYLADFASFNGHPPLGVNATAYMLVARRVVNVLFQWAPTLGGECYSRIIAASQLIHAGVSMGTHPWG